jgi:uncharacterized protein (DUF2062 family)
MQAGMHKPAKCSDPAPTGTAAGRMRRLVYQLRTEGGTPARDAVAIGTGVFVGCSPWYGFHLAICWLLGRLLRLNRLKMYLAANISNPLMAPLLILSELQAGAWVRRGAVHALTLETVRTVDPWIFGADLVVGSVLVGLLLGAGFGMVTWLTMRNGDADPAFAELVRRASDRYVGTSITAWEFARGKMRGDPLYRTVVTGGLLPSGGVLVDVGCGQGLMLALLAQAAEDWAAGAWAGLHAPPRFVELVGIETRPRVAALARRALGGSATIVAADARTHAPRRCRVALCFDVLHMMSAADQEQLLAALAAALEPGGIILVREADAGAGRGFFFVRAGNRLKALAFGHWFQTFHFRTIPEWTACFERAGFEVGTRAAGEGTPFANVLFVLNPRPDGSA